MNIIEWKEPQPVDPNDCPYQPNHHFLPVVVDFIREPTSWKCEACETPGDPEKYSIYSDMLRREQMIDFIMEGNWFGCECETCDDKYEFVMDLMDHMTTEQLSDFCSYLVD